LLLRIDKDVKSIVDALKAADVVDASVPCLPNAASGVSSFSRLRKLNEIHRKTTRFSVQPIDQKAQNAFISSSAPLRVVFTLTPLVNQLPKDVQKRVKNNVIDQLKRSLSSSFLKRLDLKSPEEWVDLVTISTDDNKSLTKSVWGLSASP
jgi:hypothetical protein